VNNEAGVDRLHVRSYFERLYDFKNKNGGEK